VVSDVRGKVEVNKSSGIPIFFHLEVIEILLYYLPNSRRPLHIVMVGLRVLLQIEREVTQFSSGK